MDPIISIVVPAYNEEENIVNLLHSLKKQNLSQKYEIIIVDNKSTDNTIQIIKQYKIKYQMDNLKVISSSGKLGKVRNTGVAKSKGKWIIFIDADEIAGKNWLKNLMEKINDYDILIGSVNVSNAKKNSITKFFDLYHKEVRKNLKKNKNIKMAGTGNLLVNRKIFDNGIMFDNNFPTSEDGDFTYRAFKKGYKFGYVDDAKIYHKLPQTMRQLFYYEKKMIIGSLLLLSKHSDWNTFFKLIYEIFFWINPNYLKIYKKNDYLSKISFIFIGYTLFFINLLYILNPFQLFRLKKKITRPK